MILEYDGFGNIVVPKGSFEQVALDSWSGNHEPDSSQAQMAIRAVLAGISKDQITILDGEEDVTRNASSFLAQPHGARMETPEIGEMLRNAAEKAKSASKEKLTKIGTHSNIVIVSNVFGKKTHSYENTGYLTRASEWVIRLMRGQTGIINNTVDNR